MKAAVYHGRRDLRIEVVADPGRPGPGEVLLRVTRAAVCGTDVHEYLHGPQFTPLTRRDERSGHLGPMVIGHEFTGQVLEVGGGVEGLTVGQRVVPGAGMWCGECRWCRAGRPNLCARYYTLGLNAPGGMAELARAPARMCRAVPSACSDDAAAMAQPLAVALHAVRRSGARPGDTAVLMGVGGIGAFMLAAARAHGLERIIVVDVDEDRLARARRLGAAVTIAARRQDPLTAILEHTDGAGADVFMEASGAAHGPALALEATARGGRVLLVGLHAEPRALDLHRMVLREIEMTTTAAHVCDVDLPEALDVLATTALAGEVLDRVIPLDALVEDGLLPLSDGRARGKVVISAS